MNLDPGNFLKVVNILVNKQDILNIQVPQPIGLRNSTFGLSVILSVSHQFCHNLKPCDWSTRFMRVISLGLSSVSWFCSTDCVHIVLEGDIKWYLMIIVRLTKS